MDSILNRKKGLSKHAQAQSDLVLMKDLLLVVLLKSMANSMMLTVMIWFTESTEDAFITNNHKLDQVDQIFKAGIHGRPRNGHLHIFMKSVRGISLTSSSK